MLSSRMSPTLKASVKRDSHSMHMASRARAPWIANDLVPVCLAAFGAGDGVAVVPLCGHGHCSCSLMSLLCGVSPIPFGYASEQVTVNCVTLKCVCVPFACAPQHLEFGGE